MGVETTNSVLFRKINKIPKLDRFEHGRAVNFQTIKFSLVSDLPCFLCRSVKPKGLSSYPVLL